MWIHWTAHTRAAHAPFRDIEAARWMWRALERLFPDALSAALLLDHLHLVLPESQREKNARELRGLLGASGQSLGIPWLWQRLLEPEPLPNREHLRRTLRYVALNPCRDNLCRDPLEWPWSTYRDVLGATANPWTRAERLMTALKERGSPSEFKVRFHAYVSGEAGANRNCLPRGSAAPHAPCNSS